jgi:hypothetical protein
MTTRIALIATLLMSNATLQGQAGTAAASAATDHPSNGVVELVVKPILDPELLRGSDHREVYSPWTGLVEIAIRNVSVGMAHLVEVEAQEEYTFDVLDSSGKSVALTESGKERSDRAAHPDPHRPSGFVSVFELAPFEELKNQFDFATTYQVHPGQAYKIRLKRTKGLPTVDVSGKPLKQVEVSCSVEIPEFGILR